MKKVNSEKLAKKELKEKMENRLLMIMAVCLVSYIAMLFTYRGFLSGSTILMMKPILYIVSGVFALGAIVLAALFFLKKGKAEHRSRFGNWAIVCAVIAVCVIITSKFNIYAIKVLAVALTVYLVDAVVYYSYYMEFLSKKRLKNILFGCQFILLCGAFFLLLQKMAAFLTNTWVILFPISPLSDSMSLSISIGIGVLLGLIGVAYLVYGIFIAKNKKKITLDA